MIKSTKTSSSKLCSSFSNEAKNIWVKLEQARRNSIIRDEETVTNDLLLNLQDAHPNEITIFQFNKREEGFTGADWEWWLTDNKDKWLGLLVQAKILNRKGNKYSAIRHKVGKPPRPQIELLLEQSRLKTIDALYFFYNYLTDQNLGLSWKCGSFPFDAEQLGCTVAHAENVQNAVRQGGIGWPTINPISFPLRCLICCPAFSRLNDSFPE